MARLTFPDIYTPVKIYWSDITTDDTGSPVDAADSERITIAFYLGKKTIKGRVCLMTTNTLEDWENPAIGNQSGWAMFPIGAVHRIEVMGKHGGRK